jgi:hypothetical protein
MTPPAYLDDLAWRYRHQIPEHLVPIAADDFQRIAYAFEKAD